MFLEFRGWEILAVELLSVFVFAVIILGNSCCNWGPVLSGVGVVEPVKSGPCYADGSSGSVSCEYTKNNVVLSFIKIKFV